MENIYPSNLEQVLFKDLNREVLYKLFINSNAQSMDVDEIGMIDEGVQSSPKEREVRHRVEKLLFLNLLMDYDLENQIERRKNAKYDYMNGISNMGLDILKTTYNHLIICLDNGVNF